MIKNYDLHNMEKHVFMTLFIFFHVRSIFPENMKTKLFNNSTLVEIRSPSCSSFFLQWCVTPMPQTYFAFLHWSLFCPFYMLQLCVTPMPQTYFAFLHWSLFCPFYLLQLCVTPSVRPVPRELPTTARAAPTPSCTSRTADACTHAAWDSTHHPR